MSVFNRSIGFGVYGDDNLGTVYNPIMSVGPSGSPPHSGKHVCDQAPYFKDYVTQRENQIARLKKGEIIWIETTYSDPVGREVPAPPAPKKESVSEVAGFGGDVTAAIQAVSMAITGSGVFYGAPKKYQLTLKKAIEHIKEWERQANLAKSGCDKIIAEHGSVENQKRYDYQVRQRAAALHATSQKMAMQKCAELSRASAIANTENSKIQKAKEAELRAAGAFPTRPIAPDWGKVTPEERAAYSKAMQDFNKANQDAYSKINADPAVKKAQKKSSDAYHALNRCKRDEEAQARRELDYKMPVPKRGDSPCGPMPSPSRSIRDQSQHIRVNLGDIQNHKTSLSRGGLPFNLWGVSQGLTCCPSDKKWYTHAPGTFFTCPGSEMETSSTGIPKINKKAMIAIAAAVGGLFVYLMIN